MKRLGIEGARPTVRPTSFVLLLWGSTFKKSSASTSWIKFYSVESLIIIIIIIIIIIVTPFPSLKNSFDFRISWNAELRPAVAGLLPRRPWFDPRSVHVGIMGDKVAPRMGKDSGLPLSVSFPLCLIITFYKFHTFVSFAMFFTRKNRKST